MAAKGGKFTSGNERSPRAVTSKPTSKGYSVRNKAKGTTRTVTTSTPTVIVSQDNGVVTGVSGTASKRAKRVARKRAEARTQRRRAVALLKTPSPQNRSQRVATKAAKKYAPPRVPKSPTPVPSPDFKPPSFQGKKTVGEPTLKELKAGSRSGRLKVNKRDFVTTPKVRKAAKTVRRLRTKARKSDAPLPGLDREQSRVANKVIRRGEKAHAPRVDKIAAVETGLVESDMRNLPYGDADSKGFRQERTSIYGDGPTGPMNVKASADRLYSELRTDPGTSTAQTPGLKAQAAQGSAYPERYDEREGEALAILQAHNKGGLKPAERKKLKGAEASASRLGLKGLKNPSVGPPPKKVVKRFRAIKVLAHKIEKLNIPYVYGGGHNGGTPDPSEGLDCSSSTVYLLRKAGVKVPNITSGEFGNYLPPGPGAVTVFYNPTHVFLRIGKEYWGTSAGDSGAGGLGKHPAPSAAYLAQYSVAHVPGLGKKQALQLGFNPTTPQSFPGMTLSSSGTSATIDSGAGATVGKPGFSSKPIQLTPRQKYNRANKKLKALSVARPSTETEASGGVSIADLERKYGKAAA